MKKCRTCGLSKTPECFNDYARYSDRKHRDCRECCNAKRLVRRRSQGMKPIAPLLERVWGNIQECHHEELCPYCCWEWQKAKSTWGYGMISITHHKKTTGMVVTRFVYEFWNARQVPAAIHVCHHCDNPSCCNPFHLWLGTPNDNRQDCVRKNRTAKGFSTGHYTQPQAYPKGEQSSLSKLQQYRVFIIRTAHKERTVSAKQVIMQLALIFGVSPHTIKSVIRRMNWKHIE